MVKYAALLRGISPSNPNMRNEKLRSVFESLGFVNVQTVISSGNVLFESPSENAKELETIIEKALLAKLGFSSTTIIRSKEELQKLVDKNPFKGIEETPKSRLNVTFLKNKVHTELKFPHRSKDKTYELLGIYDGVICSVVDLTGARTPDLMLWLEKQFGKEITTRTRKTVMRILNTLQPKIIVKITVSADCGNSPKNCCFGILISLQQRATFRLSNRTLPKMSPGISLNRLVKSRSMEEIMLFVGTKIQIGRLQHKELSRL